MSPELLSPIIETLARQLAEHVQELNKQIPAYNQYSFVFPNPNELAYLLNNNDSYQEYSLALGWIEDILLNYTERLIKPTLSPEEAKHRYFEVLRQPENELLAENLSINYATAVRLSQLAEKDKELANAVIGTFLDNMADWLNHFRETVRTSDKNIIQSYIAAKGIQNPPDMNKPATLDEELMREFQIILHAADGTIRQVYAERKGRIEEIIRKKGA